MMGARPGDGGTTAMLLGIGGALAALMLGSNLVPPYELFHDELYYWVGARRPELGYVDHPPLAPWILAASVALLGDDWPGFAAVPALCALGTVFLTGRIARSLGAGRFGQLLAGLSVAVVPTYLVFFSFFSVNAIELLLWTAASAIVIERIRTGDDRWWLAFGLVVGLAFLNKHTVLLLVFGLAIGHAIPPHLRELRSRWLWAGAASASLIALPNLVWNATNGWPSWVFYRARGEGILEASIVDVLILQLSSMNPVNLLIWAPGLWFLLFSKAGRPYRPLGIAFVVLFVVILLAGQRRIDRMAGILPIVLAAGAVVWDGWRPRGSAAARAALATLLLVTGLLLLPASVPVLPPEDVADYFEALGEKPEIEVGDVGASIPLWFTGRLEWERFAGEVRDAWRGLPADDRERSVILAPHWVFASVVEYYGRDEPGPPVVSPHNAYYFWREDAAGRDVVVAIGVPLHVLDRYFGETRLLAHFRCTHCPVFRPDLPIHVARRPVRPLESLLEEWQYFGIAGSVELRVDRDATLD